MPGSINRRAVRWLRGQLPELVAARAISSENARAIDLYYGPAESRTNFGFVILATVGAALVGAGIILLIAHNWDDLSRATRTIIAFLPLLIAQASVVFVLMRRNESPPWREAVAVFDVAAVATAISLISQTYQIQGSFADFMRVWLLLSIPIVYLLRTTVGAVVYIIGTIVWLFAREVLFVRSPNPMLFWALLLLVIPYFLIRFRNDRDSRETATLAIMLVIAATFGLGLTADFVKADLGGIAFAGLFATIYLCGIKFFPRPGERLHVIALLGGIGIGVTAIVLSFAATFSIQSGCGVAADCRRHCMGPCESVRVAEGRLAPHPMLVYRSRRYQLLCALARDRHPRTRHSHQQHCPRELRLASDRRACHQPFLRQ